MRYLKGTRFRIPPQSQTYKDNWDAVFGESAGDKTSLGNCIDCETPLVVCTCRPNCPGGTCPECGA